MAINIINPAPPLDGQVLLSYNGLDLQIVRTEEWLCEPETDWSGVDYCLNHIIIGVKAVVNPFATGTSAFPVAGGRDRAGVTMANIQQILMVPRQFLRFRIGPDTVVASPMPGSPCDAKNGPKPLACRIIEVKGTKSAIIYFRIETWIGGDTPDNLGSENFVLSNRWSVSAHVDEDWKTTITTHGRMRVRTDGLQSLTPPSPDIFRTAVLPLPVPDGFKRDDVDIIAKEDGTELIWTCKDVQKSLNLVNGADFGMTRIEGHYTTGSEVPFKDIKDMASKAFGIAAGLATTSIAGTLWNLVASVTPSVRNSFYIKLTGPPPVAGQFGGKVRQNLLVVAIAVALDRFAPTIPAGDFNFAAGTLAFTGSLVSLYATVSIQDVAVELRGEIIGTVAQTFKPALFSNRINLADDVTGANAGLYTNILNFKGATGANPNPPHSNTSRGTFVGTLLEQKLKGAFVAPVDHGEAVATDADGQQLFR